MRTSAPADETKKKKNEDYLQRTSTAGRSSISTGSGICFVVVGCGGTACGAPAAAAAAAAACHPEVPRAGVADADIASLPPSRLPAFPRKQKSSQRMATAVEARATLAKSRGCTNTNAGMGMGTGMGRNRSRSRYKTSRWTHGRGSSFVERTTGRRVGLLITSTVLELLREDAVAFAGPAKRTGLSAEEIKDVLAEDLAVRQYFVRYQSHQYLPMYSPESIRTFAVTNFCTRQGLHTNSCTQNCVLTPETSSVK